MNKSKLVKKLTMILFTLVAVFSVGLTNVNAETKTVSKFDELKSALSDKTSDVVKLSDNITLEDAITKWNIYTNKTLDLNGFSITVPNNRKVEVYYYDTIDFKIADLSNSKTSKINYNYGSESLFNFVPLDDAYYGEKMNLTIDGVDIISPYNTTSCVSGKLKTVKFMNMTITGFWELAGMGNVGGIGSLYLKSVTKNSNGSGSKTYLSDSTSLTVHDVIDANSVVEYYSDAGVKVTADRTATLGSIDAYYGPITVKFANSIKEIRLVGDVQKGNVPAGILPSFNPGTTTDSITIDRTNSSWEYKMQNGGWSGFGLETPVAYNDDKTDYGYSFSVKTNDGYQLDYSNLKVFYNEEEVTSSVKILKYPWGAYVTVDLGRAKGENPTTHTVTFNSNGGTEIAPKEVVSGLKIKAPETPTKDKYLFIGWYEDDTFSVPFDFNNSPITSDMTLYAKWEAANSINEIRLVGDIQSGTVSVGTLPSFNPRTTTDSITIDRTNSAWAYKMQNGLWSRFGLETPTAVNDGKTNYGYDFSVKPNYGYQLASDLKVIYNDVDVTSTVKVQAYAWGAYVTVDLGKANGTPVVYTITFNSNDGTPVAPQNVNAGEKLTKPTPAPTKDGFTFDGWYEDSTFSKEFDFNTPITDSMTLYAKWTENKYTLTFDANGGSGTMAPIADLTGEYDLPANEFTAPTGKQFKGWSLTTDGATVSKVAMTENRTVYAIWEDIPVSTYTLTFDANGGTGSMTAKTGLTGEYDLPANEFTAPSGKKFKGWSLTTDGAIVTKVDMTENKTVYAIWENIIYTVTFNSNGGTSVAPQDVNAGEKITEPTPAPTREGFTFDGWYEDSTFSTKFNFDTPITSNLNLYANWTENKYTLTLDANGGTGSMTAKTGLTGEYTLPDNEFTAPSGKQFKGWSLTTDGAIVTKVDMTENKTVYAIWENIIYSYEFLENTGEQTIDGKANSFKIVIDADETKFVSLEIDGVLYEKDVDYTVKHGSTIIEFTSTGLAKLNALSKGEHNVRVTFTDEVINGKITVNNVNPPIIPQNPDIDNPQTYDGIFTYITMFVVSILGLITAVIIGKKRTRTN
mgnify:CR=1 FL=1